MMQLDEGTKHLLDIGAVMAFLSAIAGFLPPVATAFTIVWLGIRIFETDTVQRMFGRAPVQKKADD